MSQFSSNQQRGILDTHRRRLELLELRAAREGRAIDPAVTMEIEYLKAKIQQIEQSLAGASSHNTPNSTAKMASVSSQSVPHAPIAPQQSSNSNRTQIIVAVISLIGVVLAALIGADIIPFRSSPQSFSYAVSVETTTGQKVHNARVTLVVPGKAPLDDVTDSNGFVRIPVDAAYARQSGRLQVEAEGFDPYLRNIDFDLNKLPQIIQLKPLP